MLLKIEELNACSACEFSAELFKMALRSLIANPNSRDFGDEENKTGWQGSSESDSIFDFAKKNKNQTLL